MTELLGQDTMQIPSFHDGTFDGFRIGPGQQVQLYLSTAEAKSFVLGLQGIQAMSLTGIKQGNIILDLVIRVGSELTSSDIEQLYGMADNPMGVENPLKVAVQKGLRLLEINPSYGAEGLILFHIGSYANTVSSTHHHVHAWAFLGIAVS